MNYVVKKNNSFDRNFEIVQEILANKIKNRRDELTLYQLDLYSDGLSPSTISRIESKLTNPSIKILCQLSLALDISLTDMVKDIDVFLDQLKHDVNKPKR